MDETPDPLVLFFLNPALRDPGQPQVTVRLGKKWLGTENQRISIRRTGEKSEIADGIIWSTFFCTLSTVPQESLDLEHDEACRTPEGLLVARKREYEDITPDDGVTVVTFSVDSLASERGATSLVPLGTLAEQHDVVLEPSPGETPDVDEMLAALQAEEATPPRPSIADELREFEPVIDFVSATFTRLFSGNASASVRRGVKQLVPGPAFARDKESDEKRLIFITRVSVLRFRFLNLADAWENGLTSLEELQTELRGFYPGLGDDPEEMVTLLRLARV